MTQLDLDNSRQLKRIADALEKIANAWGKTEYNNNKPCQGPHPG